jgi:hypothetical protein
LEGRDIQVQKGWGSGQSADERYLFLVNPDLVGEDIFTLFRTKKIDLGAKTDFRFSPRSISVSQILRTGNSRWSNTPIITTNRSSPNGDGSGHYG